MTVHYKIVNLDSTIDDGVVTTVHWRASLEDNGFLTSTYGAINVDRDETSDVFIPFENLTEDIVIEWVKSCVDIHAIEAILNDQLDALKAPKQISGLPWKNVTLEPVAFVE